MQDDEPSRPERRIWRPDIGGDIDDELAFHLEERADYFRPAVDGGTRPFRRRYATRLP
jgi:hypothetical protein